MPAPFKPSSNLLRNIIIGVIIGSLVLWLILNWSGISTWISGILGTDSFNASQIGTTLSMENIIGFFEKYGGYITAVTTVGGLVYGLYETKLKKHADSLTLAAEQQKLNAQNYAKDEVSKVYGQLSQAETKINELQTLVNNNPLHSSLQEAQLIITQKVSDIKSRDETITVLKALNIEQAEKLAEKPQVL